MSEPKPVSGVQLAALIDYVSAMLYFMTTKGNSPRRLLDAKAAMETAFGVKLPKPGQTEAPPVFPDLL